MKFEVFEAKNLEDAKNAAIEAMNVSEEEIISTYEEKKGKLFKAGSVLFKAIKITDVAEFIKNNLKELLENMNIEAQFETNIRNSQINIKMYSDKNNILIGKNGQTLMAILTILRQQVYNQINSYPHILLDVENYKEKKLSHLERNAKRIAREVLKTKIDVELENMNSYERRIIHNALSEFKNITTTSEGEEPNRHIVIRYKKED